ncbi:molybdopterin dehydrogenase FAD-binding [Methylobacterium sp. 4-46]|uniref:FAD binding domain-containing protein n=1 Tax=unclassified Methylobacterium TaxID=2615210 RepID=UPI000152CDE3|nr:MULTISPECIES: FAD binding domain-containing protein [Methylobacterium]ACA16447.1 molybdopterin dehydrogenase FAD-binding [Methylobacterium sp. 4-46]WFT82157.1 FAD binding domain-containing protein [Methylobacterium nodulans]
MRYFRPTTLAEALAIRRAQAVTVLAGGTDLYPAAASRRAWGDPAQPDILDISAIPELRGIAEEGGHWRIGALATWTDLIRADLPPLLDGLKRAGRAVGGVQIQNRGTLVGNACTASPAGDGIPNLLALDAVFEVSGRDVPARDFFTGYRTNAVGPQDLVTAIRIPKRAGRGHFEKLGARRYLVISIAMAALAVETGPDGRVREARIAVGACGPVARRLTALEADLRGVPLAAAPGLVAAHHLADLAPIDDVRASAAYRRAAARALVADGLSALIETDRRAA